MPAYKYKRYKKDVKKAGGKETATPAQFKTIQQRIQKQYGRPYKTARTSAIEKALRNAGLTEKDIAKLRGK